MPSTSELDNLNNISIRCLSKNEYTKYIRNSTLDGAISAYNANVWHMPVSYLQDVNGDTYGNLYYPIDVTADHIVLHFRYTHGNGGTMSTSYQRSFNSELCANNRNNLAQLERFHITLSFQTAVRGSYGSVTTYNPITTDVEATKTSTNTTKTFTTTAYDGTYIGYYNMLYYSCFRPAFQYIDNTKSSNIYR